MGRSRTPERSKGAAPSLNWAAREYCSVKKQLPAAQVKLSRFGSRWDWEGRPPGLAGKSDKFPARQGNGFQVLRAWVDLA